MPRYVWQVSEYSHAVVHPHQADAVDGQDAVARLQFLTLGGGRVGNHRLDVDAAHPQLSFLCQHLKEIIRVESERRALPPGGWLQNGKP